MKGWVEVDGSIGEGGGQILRTALTLSILLNKPFHMYNIRSKRRKSGLRPQHLNAVRLASKISRAQVEGGDIDSEELTFKPTGIYPGNYDIDIPTAGAATLIFQTVVLPLSFAERGSRVSIGGGTHVPWSPSFEYLVYQWQPFMERIGYRLSLQLDRAGFYPRGGGRITAMIKPCKELKPLQLLDRGPILQVRGVSAVANLPRSIAERQRQRVIAKIGGKYPLNDIRLVTLPSVGKGTTLLLNAQYKQGSACYFSLGEKGKPAEVVADEAVESLVTFHKTNGVIDQYLADQLVLPLLFAKGKSEFMTSNVTNHLITNVEIIRRFTGVDIWVEGDMGESGRVIINSGENLILH